MNFDEAKDYLESKSSLQEAIDSFFNGDVAVPVAPVVTTNDVIQIPDESSSSSLPPIPELDPSDPDYVRPPVAPKRDILILPEEDNFRRRYNVRQALCPMRNFAREGELQEQMLFAGGEGSSRPRRNRLEDVFRPPTDLIFAGTFQMVKEFAKNENKWLIVNLQDNTEFACQVLNRDIWSYKELKAAIKKYFVFYQVSLELPGHVQRIQLTSFQTSIDCVEGNKIRSFYNISPTSFPYVGILDPRTGEEQIACKGHFKYTAEEYCKELFTFLHNNYTPDYVDSGKTPSKYQTDSQGTSSQGMEAVSSVVKDLSNIISLTEEEQLEIAIKKSMEEAAVATVISDDSADEYEEPDVSDDDERNASKPPSPKKFKKNEGETDETVTDGPQTKLMIKQPNGNNEVITRGSMTKIGALLNLLQRKYRDQIGTHKCRVYCPVIRQELCDMDRNLTLEQAKLHPSAVLHISAED